jgi:hypothetical protein
MKLFDLIARGIAQVWRTAEYCRISFDEIAVELMLRNQKAKAIAEPGYGQMSIIELAEIGNLSESIRFTRRACGNGQLRIRKSRFR